MPSYLAKKARFSGGFDMGCEEKRTPWLLGFANRRLESMLIEIMCVITAADHQAGAGPRPTPGRSDLLQSHSLRR